MEQQTGFKLGKEYIKPVHCHPAYLSYMQSTSWEMPGCEWMNHKLESRLLGEISMTYDTTIMAESKEELESLVMIFWNSLAFSRSNRCRQLITGWWSLVPLPFLSPACISGSSQFIYCWSLASTILSNLASMWNECNCVVVEHSLALPFFGMGMKFLWPLLNFPNLLAYWAQRLAKGDGRQTREEMFNITNYSLQFSSLSQSCPALCDPMDRITNY